MSHELKTPLTDLREGAELLTDEVVGPLTAEQREVVAILRENSLRLQQLIEGLLDFNQALMRNLTLHKAPVQLADLVNEVIEAQKLAWRARSLRVEARLEPLELTGDRDKLATVVDNLLSNAIKFSPPGRTVWIELKAVDGIAQLEVRDAGAGFHPDDQGRVFEAFYQGRTVADGHVKGSGLGLAIALEYAKAHDGALRIGPGPGGRVRLQLPMQPRESL
ncbi:MAG: ATP-binding protein [Pseudomonadota bacterium]|nr:ATP-binding protein [Pseudomonadota bacterium]